jgi:hypothetical protein
MKYSLRSLMTFSIRDMLWLTVVVALALALVYTKRPSAPGRYQVTIDSGSDGRTLYVDTVTGKTWVQYTSGPKDMWRELKTPDLSK